MDFGFQGRGGTAPALGGVGYGRTTRVGRTVAGDPYRYSEHIFEGVGDALGLPKAPVFRGQRQGKSDKKASAKKNHGCRHQSRPSWGKRHTEGNKRTIDGVGSMLSTLPASRQALSELMDLNLSLKYDKMGRHREARKQDTQHTIRSSARLEGHTADSPSTSRCPASFDKQAPTSTRYSSPSERYYAKANHTYDSLAMDVANGLDQAVIVQPEHPGCSTYDQEQRVRRDGSTRSVPSHTTISVSPEESLMISPSRYVEVHSSVTSPAGRVPVVATLGDQFKAASRVRRIAAKTGHEYSRSFVAKRGFDNEADLGTSANCHSRPKSTCEQDHGIESEEEGEQGQDTRLSCHETSSFTSQQSDKDQRMWSELKTTLLSEHEREVQEDPCFVGLRTGRPIYGGVKGGDTQYNREGNVGTSGDGRSYTFLKGTRDLEQLDLERSAMDRTMRPHRVASARLLETNQESPSPSKVKHPRNFSASASRPRTRQSESINSVWLGAGGILQCTGVRAQLVPQNGNGHRQVGITDDAGAADVESYPGLTGEVGIRQRVDGQQLARKTDVGRFQWVTNDEGVANFLQRPPSRQKEAFPTDLADVVPYSAFQVGVPIADEETKSHSEATRKNAVEQVRPPSRHKPPVQSLFLDVPETRRQVPPVLTTSQGAVVVSTESCRGLPPGRHSIDGADIEATTAGDELGEVFALDRRHDNPDRDGFSVLQVQGPCPFRIEVINSFVHPHPPTEPVGREVVVSANRGRVSNNKSCPPDPTSGFCGTISYDTGGHASAGKQRAPINTTPNPAVCSLGSPLQVQGDAVGKGTCPISFRMIGSRTTRGAPLRGTGGVTDGSARGEDGVAAGEVQSPCTRSGFRGSEYDVRGGARAPVGTPSLAGEGFIEENARRKADAIAGGSIATGRSDTSALRVNTGAAGINVSDWSLQSCDDADDGSFLEGPGSTLGGSAGTKHALLDTTLSQDFLSLFAPSSCRDNGSVASTFDTF